MPYIPEKHKKYNLLPKSTESGREVFSYPSNIINKLSQFVPEDTPLEPFQYKSYDEYYCFIDCWVEHHKSEANISNLFLLYKKMIHQMNIKENWSVLKYIGKDTDNLFGLKHGYYYYWPCSIEFPFYEGVIDDEEFTSYLYPTDSDLWRIAEDPLGMAYNTIFNGVKSCSKENYNKIMAQIQMNFK